MTTLKIIGATEGGVRYLCPCDKRHIAKRNPKGYYVLAEDCTDTSLAGKRAVVQGWLLVVQQTVVAA